MKNIQKRSVIAAIVVCAGAAIMAGVVSKQPVKETTFPLQAEEPGTEGKQPHYRGCDKSHDRPNCKKGRYRNGVYLRIPQLSLQ